LETARLFTDELAPFAATGATVAANASITASNEIRAVCD
jgi:hypothetical protein